MRLIDADALYRRIKTECNPYGKPTIDFESGNQVLDIIDNAPTVEPTFGLFKEMLCTECDKRPHGEWLHPYITDIACECSICHVQMPTYRFFFCPNCGAEMRGGRE